MNDKKRQSDEARRRDADAIISRVEQESETLGTSSLVRAADQAKDHFSGADADPNDPVEVWGRRVGRGLSLIAFILLAIWLVDYLSR